MDEFNSTNSTSGYENNHYPEVTQVTLRRFAISAFVMGLLITSLSAFTIFILRKCRKLSAQIRLMSIHMTVANLVYGLSAACSLFYFVVTGSMCSSLFKLPTVAFVIFYIFLSAVGLDRLLSLKYSIKYRLWNHKIKVHVVIICLYIIGICLSIPNFTTNPTCSGPDDLFTYSGLFTFVISLFILIGCDVVIYFYIGLIAWKARSLSQIRNNHRTTNRINEYNITWSSTLKSFILSVITIVLLGPFVAVNANHLWHFDHDHSRVTPALLISMLLTHMHQIICPIFILVSYKECRYHVATLCCVCCKDKMEKLEINYKQHYATYIITNR